MGTFMTLVLVPWGIEGKIVVGTIGKRGEGVFMEIGYSGVQKKYLQFLLNIA